MCRWGFEQQILALTGEEEEEKQPHPETGGAKEAMEHGRSVRTRWPGTVPRVVVQPVELRSALRGELDWSCLREKGCVSPNRVCAGGARSGRQTRAIAREPAVGEPRVQLDLANPDSRSNRLSCFLDSHLNLQIFTLKTVGSSRSLSQVISLICAGSFREEPFCLAKPVLTSTSVSVSAA